MLWSFWIIYTVFYLTKSLIKYERIYYILKHLFSSWFIFRKKCAHSTPDIKIMEKGAHLYFATGAILP